MRLIDADALIIDRIETEMASNEMGLYISKNQIDHAPAVDAVEVVRCGECKWWKCADDTEIIKYGDCTHPYSAVRKNCLPNETWFCADGERKEKEND